MVGKRERKEPSEVASGRGARQHSKSASGQMGKWMASEGSGEGGRKGQRKCQSQRARHTVSPMVCAVRLTRTRPNVTRLRHGPLMPPGLIAQHYLRRWHTNSSHPSTGLTSLAH